MTMAGNTFSTLVREVYTPQLESTIFFNNSLFDLFPVVDAPGGTAINTMYEYSISTNAGTYNYDDAMVEPFTSSHVRAYFNKDHFQESARVFNVYLDYMKNGGSDPSVDAVRDALDKGAKNLLDMVVTTMLTDLESYVDAANTYSDAALTRATYDQVSYEEDTSTALTINHLEDCEEALLQGTSFGNKVRSRDDLVWLVPQNQLTNISRLGALQSNAIFSTSTQGGDADYGRQARMKTFNGVDILTLPDMTSTTLLLMHKPDVAILRTRPLTVVEKQEKADTMLWQMTCAYNIVVKNAKNHGKLSAKTA